MRVENKSNEEKLLNLSLFPTSPPSIEKLKNTMKSQSKTKPPKSSSWCLSQYKVGPGIQFEAKLYFTDFTWDSRLQQNKKVTWCRYIMWDVRPLTGKTCQFMNVVWWMNGKQNKVEYIIGVEDNGSRRGIKETQSWEWNSN